MTDKSKPFTAARAVPYSSIVGGGIMLLNEKGACVAQLAIMAGDKEHSDAISAEVMKRLLATSDSQASKDVLEEHDRALHLMRQAHAVMRQCGWQLAPGAATDGDGVLELAAAEIEEAFGAFLNGEAA